MRVHFPTLRHGAARSSISRPEEVQKNDIQDTAEVSSPPAKRRHLGWVRKAAFIAAAVGLPLGGALGAVLSQSAPRPHPTPDTPAKTVAPPKATPHAAPASVAPATPTTVAAPPPAPAPPAPPAPPPPPPPSNAARGAAAVLQGESFNNWPAINVRGHLANYEAAGGVTDDCADLVTALLQNQGLLGVHATYVPTEQQDLIDDGYHQVPAAASRTGDVWISATEGHTELVAQAGGQLLLGANGSASETVSLSGAGPGTYWELG